MNQPTLSLKRTSPRVKNIQQARLARKPAPRGKQPCTPQQLKEARQWVKGVMPSFPWQVGILKDFMERMPPNLSEMAVRIVLREVTSSDKYLSSFEDARYRHGLDGEQVPMIEGHRLFALGRRFERKQLKKEIN